MIFLIHKLWVHVRTEDDIKVNDLKTVCELSRHIQSGSRFSSIVLVLLFHV